MLKHVREQVALSARTRRNQDRRDRKAGAPNTMKLWKDNRIAGEYDMENKEIARQYLLHPISKIETWPLRRKLLAFICGNEGLNSAIGDDHSVETNLREIETLITEGSDDKL